MCLFNSIPFKNLSEYPRVGYKVFRVRNSVEFGEVFYAMFYGFQQFAFNKWANDIYDGKIKYRDQRYAQWHNRYSYTAGFHIYQKLREANRYYSIQGITTNQTALTKVLYEDVVDYGKDEYFNIHDDYEGLCIVARKMKIIDVIKRSDYVYTK